MARTPSSTSTRPPPRETSTTWAWASSAEPATASRSEPTSPPPLTSLMAPLTSSPDPALTLPNLTSLAALLSLCQFKKIKWVFGNVKPATEVRTVYGYKQADISMIHACERFEINFAAHGEK